MIMKKISFFLATLLMAFTFAACGSDDDDVTGNGGEKKPDDIEQIEMNISVLVGADQAEQPVPRLLAVWENNMFAQVEDPAHPDMTMFQYMNNDKSNDVVAVLSAHNVIFMQYNTALDKKFPKEALIASDNDDFSSLSTCTIDWKTGEIQYGDTYPFDAETKTRGGNDALKEPFFRMFDDISTGVDGMNAVLGKMGPLGMSAKTLCAAWTKVAIPLMKYNLYADDEIGRREFVQDYFKSAIESALEDKFQKYVCNIKAVDDDDVNIGKWMAQATWRIAMSDYDYENEDRKDELVKEGKEGAYNFGQTLGAGEDVFSETHVNPNTAVKVTMQVENMGETSITLSGAVRFDDSSYASYSSAGFIYNANGAENYLKTSVDNKFNIVSGTISGLEPATKYSVGAYYESMASSKTFYSSFEEVVTKGTVFEISSNNIDCAAKGGQATIQVTGLGYKTTWSVKSKPQWCTCTAGEKSLQVDMKANTGKEREGKIVLESKNYYQEKSTLTIDVKQEAGEDEGDDEGGEEDDDGGDDNGGGADLIAWYGTKWTFSGTMTEHDTDETGYNGSFPVSVTIEFPTANSVKISSSNVDINEILGDGSIKMEETANGMIITIAGTFSDTDEDGGDKSTWRYILTLRHTDAQHATMEWTGKEDYSGWYYVDVYKNGRVVGKERNDFSGTITISGNLTGTLVK